MLFIIHILLVDCKHISGQVSKVLKLIGSLQFDLVQIKKSVQEIENKFVLLDSKPIQIEQPSFTLPVETLEDLKVFEGKLKDADFYADVVSCECISCAEILFT